ncbi:arsinothricin resistance N-acetyltransferase ArsN1 family B [Pseudaeromonas sharmana]|uniref:Arsinothricin resistance N-acetyltransferase ArsN1 family B n=1 Tax=Pseudaeromonas sharmana TaxID=328412 RepID=A0ABV8CQC4_9GAMM
MIRPATAADAAAICTIYNYYVEHSEISFEEQAVTDAEMVQRIADVQTRYPWLVCSEGGQLLGYAYATTWKSRSAYRYSVECSVYLAPEARGRNLGTLLYQHLLPQLREAGMHMAMACIALPNAASIHLHEKMGFTKVAHFRELGFKRDRWIDVGYWQLALSRVRPPRPDE